MSGTILWTTFVPLQKSPSDKELALTPDLEHRAIDRDQQPREKVTDSNPEKDKDVSQDLGHQSQNEIVNQVLAAESGDIDAAWEVFTRSRQCTQLIDNFDSIISYERKQNSPEFYLDTITRDQEYCLTLEPHFDLATLGSRLEDLLTENEHPAYLAANLAEISQKSGRDEAAKIAANALASEDGEAIHEVRAYLSYLDRNSVVDPSPDTRMLIKARNDAITLLACQNGWQGCEQGSPHMAFLCGVQKSENCFHTMNLVDYLENFEWTPAERSGAYSALAEFKKLISAGQVHEILNLGRELN